MKKASGIWFPLAVVAFAASAALGFGRDPVVTRGIPSLSELSDTVVYSHSGYKLRRNASFEEAVVRDTTRDLSETESSEDSILTISARDTIKVPDSLRFTDPFRYKYYVALVDSLTHVQTRDSLKASYSSKLESLDTLGARLDSMDVVKIDSIYRADSILLAKAEFLRWYNSLSREERKKYDFEQKMNAKAAKMDSIRDAKEEKQSIRDSILENTPRILETFAITDTLQYKRIIAWTVEQDFHAMRPYIPDTTYNHHYNDYPFLRKDVNATWLGVAGSPAQYYNWFNRGSGTGVEFYKALEPWAFTHDNLPHYNTKTPYTELAYFGTLLAKRDKESDNLHLFTTQNISPAFNFSLLFDRYGGGGILQSEETINKNCVVQANYLGKKYLMHAGYIYNMVSRQENGGVEDRKWIRDTTVDTRDIPVVLTGASSKLRRHTFFLDQQLRIPFNFINRIKASRDSTFVFDSDSLERDITTAFIGHSSEFSTYNRKYTDNIGNAAGRAFYNDVFNYGTPASADSLHMSYLDNKLFIKLQPWSAEGAVSKLNVGIGDYLKQYYAPSETDPATGEKVSRNSVYLYAGAEGRLFKEFTWDAKGRYVLLGSDFADFDIRANAGFNFYPFRRHRHSPVSIRASFETSLKNPDFYQQRMFTNHYSWDNDFGKISTTSVRGDIDIPNWKLNAEVGYALLSGNIYYDASGIIRQNTTPMSILSASLRKDFKLGPVHLDNRALFQLSSNQEAVPVPLLALNLRYYLQFVVQRDESKLHNIMEMQIGFNAFWNTPWNSPGWNPNIGVFYNQNVNAYNNGPYFDVFVNVQWKRCCIFIKYQNAGMGWPMKKFDYFSADRYIVTESGMDGLKLGIYWPFYIQPGKGGHSHADEGGAGNRGMRASR